jgi:rubrerythrin
MRQPASGAANPETHRADEALPQPPAAIDARDAQACEACGTRMYGLHCKIVCPNCGYKRDCSDP